MILTATSTVLSQLNIIAISQALSDIINELFVSKSLRFDIIVYGIGTQNILDILNEIERLNDEKFAGKIRMLDSYKWDYTLNISALILTTNFRKIRMLCRNVDITQKFFNPIRFIIYYENSKFQDFTDIFLYSYHSQLNQLGYYLIETENSLILSSIEWFSEKFCMKRQFIAGRIFDKNLRKWNKRPLIVDKFKNYYGCVLTKTVDPFVDFNFVTKNGEICGVMNELFSGIAKKGNFKADFQIVNSSRYLDPIKILLLPSTSAETYQLGHFVSYFLEEKVSFLLSNAEPYSAYEKLLLPFDDLTWLFIVIVFIYAFLSIPIINMISMNLQNKIYGKFVTTPTLNVIGTFFGIGQQTLPDENFPRILLITFIVFCLIIRTAYQSLLFEYVAADIRKPLPKTIDELFQMNYTVIASSNPYNRLKEQIKHEYQ